MATLQQKRDSVLVAINSYAEAIFAAQEARLSARGYYLQRKATHTVPPVDGEMAAPDALAETPTDETENGSEYFDFPAQMHTCVTVNVSSGPNGLGFECIFEFDWSATGMRQQYIISGPSRVDSGWSEYDPNQQPEL